eukprot:GHVU01193511.1.p1 GENE.GHVU01193511.1~~GHVU01193511.1.p1  ORF type:complete len:106 (-),score=0.90 GHVU01193511.1:173-490(-)
MRSLLGVGCPVRDRRPVVWTLSKGADLICHYRKCPPFSYSRLNFRPGSFKASGPEDRRRMRRPQRMIPSSNTATTAADELPIQQALSQRAENCAEHVRAVEAGLL